MTVGVYIITNIKTSQVYIGSSQSIERRFRDHKYNLKKGCHHSPELQKAWDEHGESAFTFCLLQEVGNSKSLIEVEQQCIDQYKSWQDYNVQKKATKNGTRNFGNPLHCDHPMSRCGTTKSGAQRYRCHVCNHSQTDGDRPVGRQPIGDEPMTQAELDRRYRERNPEKYREIHNKKRKQ